MDPTAGGMTWSSERYQLRELVGSGGMSQVYRAWDQKLDREVAVKVLHPHLAASPDSRKRFSREARAVAKLQHPHILEIFDFSGDGDSAFIVTEFIRGRTLSQFAHEVGFGLPQLAALAAHSLCLALEHAHQAGVVHRDLKPENVMVSERGGLKLMDFGIARFLDSGDKMTMTGAMVGSPAYMAPEIIEGEPADARSDLFSLGTLLYWLLTNTLPFDAPNTSALLRRVLEVEFEDPRLRVPAISDALAEIVRSLLRRDPNARPASARAVADALAEALREDGIQDPEAELRAFLHAPAAHRRSFREGVLARLKANAAEALGAGRTAAALKLADRVLALEPSDVDAQRLVESVSARARRRGRARSWAIAVATAVALAGALFGGRTVFLRARTSAPRAEPSALNALAPPASEAATAPEPMASGPQTTESVRASSGLALAHRAIATRTARPPPRAAQAPPPPVPAAPIALGYHVLPYADVAVDGHLVASGSPAGQVSLSPGHHEISFSAAAYQTVTRSLELPTDGKEIRLRLQPKPARLRVIAIPSDASIMVDDQPRGVAAESDHQPIVLPLDKPETTAVVRVFKPGYGDFVQLVNLRAGSDTVLPAKLQASP